MSKNNNDVMKKLVSAFIVWSMIAVGIMGLFTAQVGGADQEEPVPNYFLPSDINGEVFEMRDWGVYNADYSVTVQGGGTLRIINSTLNFPQDVNTSYSINVITNSNLELINSTITTAASPQAMWDPLFEIELDASTFKMEDHSVLAFPGWFNITNTLTYINDSWITSVYPDQTLFTPYAEDFPTFTEVMKDASAWWVGTEWDMEDFENDCPKMIFSNCEDVTIADSMIEHLYEDADTLEDATPFNVTFAPTVAATSPAPVGDVNDLVSQDLDYMEVLAGLNTQTLDIDSFAPTSGTYDDADYIVNSVWVHALYNTSLSPTAGYDGNDFVEWRVDAGIYDDLFLLEPNSPPWAENYSLAATSLPSVTEIMDLDVRFINTDPDTADATVFFDVIEIIAELQRDYTYLPTMITVNDTEMTIINSYVGVDWLSYEADFQIHNAFDIIGNSNLYLLNTSIDDDDGGMPGKSDYLEIPVDADPANHVPFRVEAGSEVFYFKWANIPVIDKYWAPIPDVYINSTSHFTGESEINNISMINDLTGDTDPDWDGAKERVLDYMTRMYGVTDANFNITGTDGTVLLPLLTTYFNATNYPNGDHVGDYDLKINYTDATEIVEYVPCDFQPCPETQPDDNLVFIETVMLDGVSLPRPLGSPGIIVNATTGDMTLDGGTGEELPITDFIIVEDSATLTISNAELTMMYTGSAPFEIIVRDTGTLILENVDLMTQSNALIDLNLEDSGTLTMTDATSTSSVSIYAQESVTIELTRAEISGSLDIVGANAAVTLDAWDTQFSRNLDDITGDSVVTLVGCYSPLSPNFQIAPTDNAEVWIYRNIGITVYDGVTPAGLLEDVNVTLTNQNPIASPLYDLAGQTDVNGSYVNAGLSDYIYYNSALDEVVESHYALYWLNTEYLTDHDETTGLGLAAFPDFGINDAIKEMDVILENVLPDLDPPINIWPLEANNSVGRGDVVNIGTIINNIGDATANNIDVWFNDTFEGESEIIYLETIETLAPGENVSISFEYKWDSVSELGLHNITITVDPLNDIPEMDPDGENNNHNWTEITVTSQPDLAILYYGDVSFSETYSLVDTDFDIMANIYNIGDINATDVVVSFYDTQLGLLGNVTIPNIEPNPTAPVVATLADVSYDTSGSYYIYIAIDEANTISEVSEVNNNNSVSPLSVRYLRIWENAILNIEVLDIIVGTDLVGYNLGGGVPTTECDFRTEVTLRARVWNLGELHASNVQVEFFDGGASIGTSSIVSSITRNNDAYIMIIWEATSSGLSQVHTITAQATGTDLVSNIATQTLTVSDNRPDIEVVSSVVANGITEIVDSETFPVNVTLTNNGEAASSIRLEIFRSESDYLNTTVARLEESNPDIHEGRLGNETISSLASGATTVYTITCAALIVGEYDLFVVVDLDYNKTDYVTFIDTDYNIVGEIEEYNEANNNYTITDVTVIMPDLLAVIVLPTFPGCDWDLGETESIIISGRIVREDSTNIGISDIPITITCSDGQEVTTQTGLGGSFNVNLDAPAVIGNYTITVDGTNVGADTAWFEITDPGISLMWIIIIIILIVVAVIGGITAYLYFVGLGKTVQCGECGAFIPEGAKKCPKCGVEFEDEVAKCSVCGSWVPIDVKNCPDCGTEFTVGTEDLDDYEAKMKRQYDDIVRKFKQQAKGELGAEFTETEFQAWWATQATFVTFDQWLREEEEMKRMGSKPCHSCGTENSVTAKICHKCGTVVDEKAKKPAPKKRKPVGKAPVEKKVAETPAAAAPAEAKPAEVAGEKKSCPSCGMEVAVHENTCPICNYDFEGGEPPASPPPAGGEGAAPVKRVVKKPVKRVVKRPVQKDGQ